MNSINDELLNKFIDGELTQVERQKFLAELETSPELKKKLDMLNLTHQTLKTMDADSPKSDIKNLVMARIKKGSVNSKHQKFFLFSILSIFGVLILGIIGFVFYQVVLSSSSDLQLVQTVDSLGTNIADLITSILSKMNISILGSVLSFIIFISVYFWFENQKKAGSQLLV